jgi:hypothetical protein
MNLFLRILAFVWLGLGGGMVIVDATVGAVLAMTGQGRIPWSIQAATDLWILCHIALVGWAAFGWPSLKQCPRTIWRWRSMTLRQSITALLAALLICGYAAGVLGSHICFLTS